LAGPPSGAKPTPPGSACTTIGGRGSGRIFLCSSFFFSGSSGLGHAFLTSSFFFFSAFFFASSFFLAASFFALLSSSFF